MTDGILDNPLAPRRRAENTEGSDFSMIRGKVGFLGSVAVPAFMIGMPWAAFSQTPVRSADIAAVAEAENVRAAAGELAREEIAAEDAWYDRHELSLSADGNLPGNLRVFDDNGKLIPARVKLYFLQGGKVIAQTTPNQDGDFQAVGLKSGTYSLVAAGQSGFAALGIRILPPPERPEAPKANTIGRIREVSQPGLGVGLHLNVSVIPAVDVQPAFGLAVSSNAGGLGALPGLTGLGGAAGGAAAAGGTAATSAAAAAGGGGAAGGAAAGLGGAGGLFATGAAAAGVAAASNNNNDNSTSSSSTATQNGTN